jgi:hypothetical protein
MKLKNFRVIKLTSLQVGKHRQGKLTSKAPLDKISGGLATYGARVNAAKAAEWAL